MDFQLYSNQSEKKWTSDLTDSFTLHKGMSGKRDEGKLGGTGDKKMGKELNEISNQYIEIFDDDTEEWEEDFSNHLLKRDCTRGNSSINVDGNSQSSSLIFEDIIIDDTCNDYMPLSTSISSKGVLSPTLSNAKSEKPKANNNVKLNRPDSSSDKIFAGTRRPTPNKRKINLKGNNSTVTEKKRKFDGNSIVSEKKVKLTGDSAAIEKKVKPDGNSTEIDKKVKLDGNSTVGEKKSKTKRNYNISPSGRSPWTREEENMLMEAVEAHGAKWSLVREFMDGKRALNCYRVHWEVMKKRCLNSGI